MKVLRLLLAAFMTFLLFTLLNYRLVDVSVLGNLEAIKQSNPPAFGTFFNPFEGFWANAEPRKVKKDLRLSIPELNDRVEVVLDDRLVPHIFAKNEEDLYFAQGYITAKYRLWQMEFQTMAAAGRLSEILGERTLEYDRFQRRIGMVYAAEQAVEAMNENETARKIVERYSAGVNAYIAELSPKEYPIEYKLLDYAPEQWSPLKTALLLKYMAQDLSFRNEDAAMTNLLKRYGEEVVEELYKGYPKKHDPIIPTTKKFRFRKPKVPKKPKQYTAPLAALSSAPEDKSGIGSNNWAVSGEKTQTGYPMLANDPHLGLNLPSIWFEIQLVAPKINAYGASIPGAPGVISGFNKEVGWGITNVAPDVTDWYLIKPKDSSDLSTYWHEEQWKPTKIRLEKIKVRNGETLIDTVYFTHHGPIVARHNEKEFAFRNNILPGTALRWLAHDPSLEVMTFYQLNRAENYRDYRQALQNYTCPAQNFVFADIHQDIAITSNGKMPLKWKEQGKFVLDGTNPEHDWQDWLPYSHNPYIKNPERGFVSSANQFPAADTLYPYYMHWKFATYERGVRINERLTEMSKITVDSLRNLQNDSKNLRAQDVLPLMLANLPQKKLSSTEREALKALKQWDYFYTAEATAATIFEVWWQTFYQNTWQDEFGTFKLPYPRSDRTAELMELNDSLPAVWFDNIQTTQKETMQDILQQSFQNAINSLQKKYGNYGESWQWHKHKSTFVRHLARIEAFGVYNIKCGGSRQSVNATGKNHGPSWRMIVALGRNPKAFVVYPGGQSGNPGSYYYDNMVNTWAEGKLYEVLYMKRAAENHKQIIARIKFSKE